MIINKLTKTKQHKKEKKNRVKPIQVSMSNIRSSCDIKVTSSKINKIKLWSLIIIQSYIKGYNWKKN
jgi:hypothetical protein